MQVCFEARLTKLTNARGYALGRRIDLNANKRLPAKDSVNGRDCIFESGKERDIAITDTFCNQSVDLISFLAELLRIF